jgi:hypothetical protein
MAVAIGVVIAAGAITVSSFSITTATAITHSGITLIFISGGVTCFRSGGTLLDPERSVVPFSVILVVSVDLKDELGTQVFPIRDILTL